jgi:hypothetical protein
MREILQIAEHRKFVGPVSRPLESCAPVLTVVRVTMRRRPGELERQL